MGGKAGNSVVCRVNWTYVDSVSLQHTLRIDQVITWVFRKVEHYRLFLHELKLDWQPHRCLGWHLASGD